MQPGILTDFFMMVLCISSAPVDQQEVRIDLVGDGGYVDTMIVRREEVGVTVYDEMNGKLIEVVRIVPKDGTEYAFVCTDQEGKKETVDLARGIKDLNVPELRNKTRLRLKTTDGVNIAVDRSDDVLFVTPDRLKGTFVVH